jgi:hypothetical protein
MTASRGGRSSPITENILPVAPPLTANGAGIGRELHAEHYARFVIMTLNIINTLSREINE